MVSQTPGRTLLAEENQATYETYLEGWRDLNRRLVRGEPWSGDERNVAFLSFRDDDGALAFENAAGVLGLDGIGDGRSAARIDIDFDGDEDIVLTNRTEPRVQVFANRLGDGVPVLTVGLLGHGASGTEALGAVVYATEVVEDEEPPPAVVPGLTQRRTRTAGSGYLAQSSAWLRFALPARGDGAEAARRSRRVRLAVRWPGTQEVEDFGIVRVGARRLILEQGLGTARKVAALTEVQLAPAQLPPFELSSDDGRRLALPAPSSIPSLSVRGASGRAARLFGITPAGPRGADQPVIAIVWDSSQSAAVSGLGALGALSKEASDAGALVVSIDLAEDPDFPQALNAGAAILSAAGFQGDELAAVGTARGVLEQIMCWRLDVQDPPPLPWSLIVGPDGRLDAVRTGPWASGEAAKDLIFCSTLGSARLLLASPFGGRWVNPPLEANLGPFRARLEKAGIAEAVRELNLARVTTASAESAEVQIKLGQAHLQAGDNERALRAFDAALESDPESALGHKARAYVLQLMGRLEESVASWGRAIELDSADANSRVNRALAYIESEELEEAARDLKALEAMRGGLSEEASAVRAALEAARGRSESAPGKDSSDSGGR
ncbi:MAG: tetratricopeptide repeat protein [Planctomycetota bacterium]